MTRLFIRIYGALVAVVGLTALLLFAGVHAGRPDPHALARWLALAHDPAPLHTALSAGFDPDHAREASRDLGLHVMVHNPAQSPLSPEDRATLAAGDSVLAAGGGPPRLWVPLDPTHAAVVGLATPPSLVLRAVFMALLVALAAITVTLSLRPLQLDLERLAAAAELLGRGQWRVRSDLSDRSAVADLGRAFDDMATRIQRLVAGREELLRGVSHELRTPVSRVGFAVDLLAGQEDADERAQRAEAIQDDLASLEAIIAELLAYTTLDETTLPNGTASLDPAPLLTRMVQDARTGPAGRTITFNEGEIPAIEADARLFKRAVANLIRNAVKYSKSQVRVHHDVEEFTVYFHVDDDGPGVPPADRARIFEPLVRLDPARSRDTGGIGLGLALARRIALAHGRRLSCSESPLGGARFTISFPRS